MTVGRSGPCGRDVHFAADRWVLNDSLADDFHWWHPGFTHVPDRQALAA